MKNSKFLSIVFLLLASLSLRAQVINPNNNRSTPAKTGVARMGERTEYTSQGAVPTCNSLRVNTTVNKKGWGNRDSMTCREVISSVYIWLDDDPRFQLKNFGARGSGDETTYIQAALDAAEAVNGTVVGEAGKTYTVSRQTGQQYTFGTITIVPALAVPSNVKFLGYGSTIKLANTSGSRAYAICNKTGASNIEIADWTLDSATQTATTSGHEIALIAAIGATNIRIHDIYSAKGIDYVGRFLGNTNANFDNLLCTASEADGWSFGIGTVGGTDYRNIRSQIGRVIAYGCGTNLGSRFSSAQGNPIIITAKDTIFGELIGENSPGGIKIQDQSDNVIGNSIIYIGGASAGQNSGVKIQGSNGGYHPTRISVNSIQSRDCYAEGLFVTYSDYVHVGSYQGYGNGVTGSHRDVFTQDSIFSIGSLISSNVTGYGLVTSTTTNFTADSITVVAGASTTKGVQFSSTGGTYNVNKIEAIDTQGTPTMLYALDQQDTTATGVVKQVVANWVPTATRCIVNSGTSNIIAINQISVSGAAISGIATLTAGGSSLISTDAAFRVFVGGVGNNYIQPIIRVLPSTTSARNLGMFVPATEGDLPTTGFRIYHGSAAGTEKVSWEITGWVVAPVSSVSSVIGTASRAMVTDSSGNPSFATVTATELGYVSGVTSAIQTQLNAKYGSGSSPSFVTLTLTDTGTATATAGAATLNKQIGTITSESLTTAAGSSYTLTLTNSQITTSSRIFPSVTNGTNTQGTLVVGDWKASSGSATIKIQNIHPSQALNGTIVIYVLVF